MEYDGWIIGPKRFFYDARSRKKDTEILLNLSLRNHYVN
jgi:hypothetical protein